MDDFRSLMLDILGLMLETSRELAVWKVSEKSCDRWMITIDDLRSVLESFTTGSIPRTMGTILHCKSIQNKIFIVS